MLEGRVVVGRDSTPLPGVRAVLHRITPDSGFAADSVTTGSGGGFSFRLPEEDPGAVHIVSVRHDGVLYFGPPLHRRATPSGYVVVVHDTRRLGEGEELRVRSRTLVVSPRDSVTEVLDVLELGHPGVRTLVGPESGEPWWGVRLPSGAHAPGLAGGPIRGHVRFENGRALSSAPVRPGGERIAVTYRLPAEGPFSLAPERSVDRLEVLLPAGRAVATGGLEGPERVDGPGGGELVRYVARDLSPGDSVRLAWDGAGREGRGLLGWLLVGLGGLLGAAALWSARRRSSGPAGPAAIVAGVLLLGGPPAAAAGTGGSAAGVGLPAEADRDTLVLAGDDGDTLRLEEPARRIVSLVPAVTELLFALGAGERVVGRTRYGIHPPEARAVPSVGAGVRPSAEHLLARDPDVVILFAGPDNRSALRELRRLEIPTLALRHDRFADLYRNLERLGRLTGRVEAARHLEERIRCELAAVAAEVSGLPPRRLYYEVWADPPMTIGRRSFLDSLVRLVGGRNVFGELEAPSARVSLEAIVARDPELVLLPAEARETAPPPAKRPGWDAIAAVRRGAVRTVDGDLVHRLGPRIGAAARALARAIHPDARLASGTRECRAEAPVGG